MVTIDDLSKCHESGRRKVLEKQYRESIREPIKKDLEEVIRSQQEITKRLSSLEHYVKSILSLIHHGEE